MVMLAYVEFLRALAAALIANSHFKEVYPLSAMSFGASIGLAIFYMISGFLLTSISEETHFISWYLKKLIRLYLPLWLFRCIEVVRGGVEIECFADFFFPIVWFTASMTVFYPLYFLIIKYLYPKCGKYAFILIGGAGMLGFCVLFILKPQIGGMTVGSLDVGVNRFAIKTYSLSVQLLWMACLSIGALIKTNFEGAHKVFWKKYGLWVCFAIFVLSTVMKLMPANENDLLWDFFAYFAYIGLAFALFRSLMQWEDELNKIIGTVFGKVIRIVSVSSLEIYYVQFTWIEALKGIAFPANWLLLVITIVASAYLLHIVSNRLIKLII